MTTKKGPTKDKPAEKKVTVRKTTVKDLQVEPGKEGEVKGGLARTSPTFPGCRFLA